MDEPTSTRVSSADATCYIEVVEPVPGTFVLRVYRVRYDDEEQVEYVVREFPDPSSRFSDRMAAISEAERLLRQWT